MISGLNSDRAPITSDVDMVEVEPQGDQTQQADDSGPTVEAVRNEWRGGYTDKILGMVSAVSMSAGAVMMGVGNLMMNGGEQSVQDGVELIKNTINRLGIPKDPTLDGKAMAKQATKSALGNSNELDHFVNKYIDVRERCASNRKNMRDKSSCCDIETSELSRGLSQYMKTYIGSRCTKMSSAYTPLIGRVKKGIKPELDELKDELKKYQGELVKQQNKGTQEINKALGLIGDGNSMTALGAGVMAFGAGCGLVGLGTGVGFLRRYLCGTPPRQ